MGAAKLSLSPLKGHDEDRAKKQHAGSVEARINNDRAPPCGTPGGGGNKSATGAKTIIRLTNEETTVGTGIVRSLHACG